MLPRFPLDLLGCDRVSEAKHWRKCFGLPADPEDDANYAECAYRSTGCGYTCESCGRFVNEPARVEVIRNYHRAVEAHEKAKLDLGANI